MYIGIMKTLKEIISNWGYITKPQLAELVEHFPSVRVVIKWGAMERERVEAWRAVERIKQVESADTDYVRSVFFSSKDMDKIKEALHIAN